MMQLCVVVVAAAVIAFAADFFACIRGNAGMDAAVMLCAHLGTRRRCVVTVCMR